MLTRASLAALLAALLGLLLPAAATATIYWGGYGAIERANLDGGYRSDVLPPPPQFFDGPWIPTTGDICALAVDTTHIYWADRSANAIGRANLDGSDPNYAFITGADEPCGVAVDGSHVYWSNLGDAEIGRANLDGSGVEQSFIDADGHRLCGLAVDASHAYWVDEGDASIGRADLDGENAEPEFVPRAGGGCGIALDGSHLYWASLDRSIGRADLDGSDSNREFIGGLERPGSVAIAAGRIYWGEEAQVGGQIGRARLDGGEVQRGFLTGVVTGPTLAADSFSFVPPAPPPSGIALGRVRHDKRRGAVLVAVDTGDSGFFKVETSKGLEWRLVGEGVGPGLAGGGRRWLRIYPASHGWDAHHVRLQLRNRGRLRIRLRIAFTEVKKATTTVSRSLLLVRWPAGRR